MRSSLRLAFGFAIITAGCGGGSDGTTPPADVNTMTKVAGDAQSATVGQAVANAPSVKVANQDAQPVAGVSVTFSVTGGGGQVTGATATTNSSGVATAGGWTLGTTPGSNTLSASASGVSGSPQTFTATATVGPPATLTKEPGGDNQATTPSTAVTVKPAVKVVDEFSNPVSGVSVTFAVASGGGSITGGATTTGADGIATVGSWTLGASEGANTLTATATGSGITGNPATFTATAQLPALSPTANMSISGDQTYSSVNVPAGVTLTITSDAVITVTGNYAQAGVVMAPCHTLTINAAGTFTATGDINNECTDPDDDGTDLVLIGQSGYDISDNEIVSSGDIWIVDGPVLQLAVANARPITFKGVRRLAPPVEVQGEIAASGPYRCRLSGMTLRARPLTKRKAASGSPKGDDGRSGTSRTSGCGQLLSGQFGGNLLVNNVTMIGGSGGDAGDGTSSTATPAVGGIGGVPGALNLVSDGDLDIQGTVTLNLGNGGKGGDATATGADGNPGVSVTATGGKGGGLKPKNFSSPVTILSKTGTLTIAGTLNVNFGTGGEGGLATATAGNGVDGNPGANGGDATANGGDGGDSEPFTINTSGSVVILGNVNLNGGTGGKGGKSRPTPGKGGNGNAPGAKGGDGGKAFGTGGKGGKGQPSPFVVGGPPIALADLVLMSPGGAGGDWEGTGGNGGDGVPNCPNTGGAGGKGGDANGGGGDRGPGTPNGASASVTATNMGNGGNGKEGNGAKGLGGANSLTFGSGVTGTVPAPGSFMDGMMGGPCPTEDVNVDFTVVSPPWSPGVVPPGTYSVGLRNAATNAIVGAMNFTAEGPFGNAFFGNPPPRVGWVKGVGSWLADMASAIVDGQPWQFTTWRVCVLDPTVDEANPVIVEQLDASDAVLARPTALRIVGATPDTPLLRNKTAQGCTEDPVEPGAVKQRHRGGGRGGSSDINGMGGRGGRRGGGPGGSGGGPGSGMGGGPGR